MYELINDVPLQVKEYNGQRVVTFKDIDSVHQRPDGTAGRNFRANREHFIEGVDFFTVCADEIRRHKIIDLSPKAHEDITLVTLSGYLMIVKSLTDDLSWSIQRLLVNSYFRVQEQSQSYNDLLQHIQSLESRIATLESKQTKTKKPKLLTIEEEYAEEIDIVLDFIDKCCMKRPTFHGTRDGITTAKLYKAFVKWCNTNDITPPIRTIFIRGVCKYFGVLYKNRKKTQRRVDGYSFYLITLRPEYINKK